MKHTVVLVLSHSTQSCVPIGESRFAVFPCQLKIGTQLDISLGKIIRGKIISSVRVH